MMFGKKDSVFEVASKTGKKVVFILFEDKVYVTLAEKKVDGTITFEINRGYRKEKYNLQIQPEQEFVLHSPKIEISRENSPESVFEYVLNFDSIKYIPRNPRDVVFSLLPYNVECIFLVYPHEVLSVDTLKNLGLIKVNEATIPGEKGELRLDVYSPTIFALDKQTIKMMSAKSRISQIDTILAMTRDLLLKGEELFKLEKPSFLGTLLNVRILIPVVLITIAILGALFLAQNMGAITSAIGRVATPKMVPTFP